VQGLPPAADYRFKHALIQDAAYENLLKSRRQVLHRRVAEVLLDNVIAPAEPELLAHHFTQAGLIEAAIEWWGKAGQRSLERSALVEAGEQLGRALTQIAALPTTPALRREEIELQVALITPLQHVKGYAAPEPRAAAERARVLIQQAEALGEPADDPLLLFRSLYGGGIANFVAFNGDLAGEFAEQFLALAEQQRSTALVMVGHRLMGMALTFKGEFAQARMHFDRAIALYNPAAHRPLAALFGQDHRMAALTIRSWALWLLGYPDAAFADAEHALNHAREIGQAATLMYVLVNGSLTHIQSGNYAAAKTRTDELLALADEKSAMYWRAQGTIWQGCVFALTGKASNAVQMITSGMTALRSTGATLFIPWYLSNLARAHAQLGEVNEAERNIGEAMTTLKTGKENWCEAEVNRTAGEISLLAPRPDTAKGEVYFNHALDVARRQQAKSWELRAAMSMARLRRDQGKRDEARDLLAPASTRSI
jgi:predicted ATPase